MIIFLPVRKDDANVVIYTDASFRKDDAGISYVVEGMKAKCRHIPVSSNVRAEAKAILMALKDLPKDAKDVTVYNDTQPLVDGINGVADTMSDATPVIHEIQATLRDIPGVKMEWIPRSENKCADALAYHALNYCNLQAEKVLEF